MAEPKEMTLPAEIESWLESVHYFQDGYVVEGDASPGLETVTLLIAQPIRIGLTPGEVSAFQIHRLTARGVKDWQGIQINPQHCMEGVYLRAADEGACLELDTPWGLRQLRFKELVVDVEGERREVRQARVSPHDIGLSRPGRIPTAAELLRAVEAAADMTGGLCYRKLGGGCEPAEHLPDDYSGWFIHSSTTIDSDHYGVFVRWARTDSEGGTLALEGFSAEPRIWAAARRALAQLGPGTIRTGNVVFTTEEWQSYCVEGQIPERYREFWSGDTTPTL